MTARTAAAMVAVCMVVGAPLPVLAHGIGGRADLPVPLSYFVVGAAVVLMISFGALAVLWPRPRLQDPPTLRPLPLPGFDVIRSILGVVGVSALALTIATGMFGLDNSTRNPSSVIVWVGFWLVLPFVAPLVGNLYRLVNPWTTLAGWLRIGDGERPGFAERFGVLPAAAALFAFTWLELVYPDSASPRAVAAAALVYSIVMFVAIDRLGTETTVRSVDGFAVYNRLFAGIAPFTADRAGAPAWRGWLRGLPSIDAAGLSVFLVVMIGTVTFDGMSATPWFSETFGETGRSLLGRTILMVVTVAVIGLGYAAACVAAVRVGGDERWTPRDVARRFAHTLVPIAFAYAFAHYFTLVLYEGQLFLSTMSDPFGTGSDLFGTADRAIDFTLMSPNAVWWVQVAVIIGGHVLGVVLAHDRALADFPAESAVRTQYAMLALMVMLTGIGLWILSAG